MKKLVQVYVLLLLVLAAGCAGGNISGTVETPGKDDSIAIMTWNVQALFDGVENGTEYDDYRESTGWTREKYRGRLNAIAQAIDKMDRKPDIIALQEIESEQVLLDLAAVIASRNYGRVHFTVIPQMALGVGLLSRFPLEEVKSHSAYSVPFSSPSKSACTFQVMMAMESFFSGAFSSAPAMSHPAHPAAKTSSNAHNKLKFLFIPFSIPYIWRKL